MAGEVEDSGSTISSGLPVSMLTWASGMKGGARVPNSSRHSHEHGTTRKTPPLTSFLRVLMICAIVELPQSLEHGKSFEQSDIDVPAFKRLGISVRKGRRQEPERHGWTREQIAAAVLGETRDRAAICGIRVGDRERLTKRLNRVLRRSASQSSLRRHTDQRKPERGTHCGSIVPIVNRVRANYSASCRGWLYVCLLLSNIRLRLKT